VLRIELKVFCDRVIGLHEGSIFSYSQDAICKQAFAVTLYSCLAVIVT
jgi:hypothetical protein